MSLEALRSLFFWCMIVNFGVYMITAVAILAFRDLAVKLQTRIMGVDEVTARRAIYYYLAGFKLLVTVFNFAPWIALVIIT